MGLIFIGIADKTGFTGFVALRCPLSQLCKSAIVQWLEHQPWYYVIMGLNPPSAVNFFLLFSAKWQNMYVSDWDFQGFALCLAVLHIEGAAFLIARACIIKSVSCIPKTWNNHSCHIHVVIARYWMAPVSCFSTFSLIVIHRIWKLQLTTSEFSCQALPLRFWHFTEA